MPAHPTSVRVRMYDVGFGDCLVLGFPSDDGERLVLIDCGVHSASKGAHDLEDAVIPDLLDLARERTGRARFEVVAISHRHRDHVHGFRDEDTWAGVEVGEVWMPWTEDPDDEVARRIKDKQSKRALQLQALALDRKGADWLPVQAIAENNFTNAKAMTTLHRGFAGRPVRSFLPQPDGQPRATSFTTDLLPGVRVHILGPARDEGSIRDMDPPGEESYLRMSGRALGATGQPLPFERWRLDQAAFFDAWKHFDLRSPELGRIVTSGRSDALALAVGLEKAVNGTSLMLVFECGDASLLMAGDAQWGTWDRVMADPRRRALATGARLYKVGHHGSHNATPRRFVKAVTNKPDVALVSVAPTGIPSWSDIPRPPLMDALATTWSRVIRSDEPGPEGATAASDSAPAVEVGPGGLWVDVRLPVRRA